MGVHLKPHNEKAYKALVSSLAQVDRSCVIQPCGTGKSFIAFKLVEENPSKSFLWVSPNDYIFSEQRANFERQGLEYPKNLDTMTYMKALIHAREETTPGGYDYVLIDELHRSGAPEWGKGIEALIEANKEAKLVGFTATSVRYADNNRDMANELFFGNVASRLTMEEAWIRGILPFPTYVCALFDEPSGMSGLKQGINSIRNPESRASVEKRYEDLRRRVDAARGVSSIIETYLKDPASKVIVFCPGVKRLEAMYDIREEWFGGVSKKIHAYKTYSSMPCGDADYKAFRDDTSDALKVLYCIDQLNEGVHVDGVGAIVMVRPTSSPIVYKQQLGRVMDCGGCETPLVFDLVNNIESSGTIFSWKGALEKEYRRLVDLGERELKDPGDFAIYDLLADARILMTEIAGATDPKVGMAADRSSAVADMWDMERNFGMNPWTVPANSPYVAYWKCGECGTSWQESVADLVRVGKCPYCSGIRLLAGVSDLATVHPEAATFWDSQVNGIGPDEVLPRDWVGTAAWECPFCGDVWDETVEDRMKKRTCPTCKRSPVLKGANDLETCNRAAAAEWSQTRNGHLKALGIDGPGDVSRYDRRLKIFWDCKKCGHPWSSTARDRSRARSKAKCPRCARSEVEEA